MGETVKLSIVIAVLDSHEIVRRQLLHFHRIGLPDDVEIILVDDGSDPPLEGRLTNLVIHPTGNTREWSQGIARNIGVSHAKGDYLICTDIDHIVSRELIDMVRQTDYDIIRFKREAGILDEQGQFTQNMDELKRYGYIKKHLRMSAHGNSYAIKKELFIRFGGSQQKAFYPNRDEQKIKRWTHKLADELRVLNDKNRPTIYMIPNGRFCGDRDYNPFGLFHNLRRPHYGQAQHTEALQAAIAPQGTSV